MARWVTFDCYGMLIDWNGGIGAQLARLWPEGGAERLLAPANALGLTSVRINRLGERARPGAMSARELPDLSGLPDALGALVA